LKFLKIFSFILFLWVSIYSNCSHDNSSEPTVEKNTWISINAGLDTLQIQSLYITNEEKPKLFAGCFSGLYSTMVENINWTRFQNLDIGDIRCIFINKNNTNQIFVGSWGKGVYYSENGGQTWGKINAGLSNPFVYTMDGLEDNDGILTVYAATDGGLFRWDEHNLDWTLIENGLPVEHILSVCVKPDDPSIIYASRRYLGIFKTTDSGDSWAHSSKGLYRVQTGDYYSISSMDISASNPDLLIAGSFDSGVFQSSNCAQTWENMSTGLTTNTIQSICLDQTDNNRIYACTPLGVQTTSDGGNQWNLLIRGLHDLDVREIVVHPANHAIIYCATLNGGVFKLNIK